MSLKPETVAVIKKIEEMDIEFGENAYITALVLDKGDDQKASVAMQGSVPALLALQTQMLIHTLSQIDDQQKRVKTFAELTVQVLSQGMK